MAFKVLITDRFELEALALLKSHAGVSVSQALQPQPSVSELAECDGMITRSRTKIDENLLALAPHLKIAITATSGFDHFALPAFEKRSVACAYTPNANAASACELTWALILAAARRLSEAKTALRAGKWDRNALIGRELQGKTLGIVGLGRIGLRVAKVGASFGLKLIAYDPYIEPEVFAREGIERLGLSELLRLADVVSFHVPATRETTHMVGVNDLEAMNRNAILINASRGSVISERNLVHALSEGWIGACGLDVFEREPLARDSRLFDFANVVLTPHLGATTGEAFAQSSREAAEKMLAFIDGGLSRVADLLPPQAEWYEADFDAQAEASGKE